MITKVLKLVAIALFSTTLTGAEEPKTSSDKIILTAQNTVVLDRAFTDDTVSEVIAAARKIDSKNPSSDPIYLVLNSPGGSVDAGLHMIEVLNSLNRPVITLSLFSASMGFQTVQGIKGERLITENGTLMSHKVSGGIRGEIPGQVDARYGHILRKIDRMDRKAVARSNGKQTLESYRALYENEYWCDGQDCINDGFADRMVSVMCGESLSGEEAKVEDSELIFGLTVETKTIKANCPLILGSLSTNIYVNRKPVFAEGVEDLKTTNINPFYTNNPGLFQGLTQNEIEMVKTVIESMRNKASSKSKKEVIRGY